MTQDTPTWYGVPSTIPSHGGNSTGVLPAGVLARVRNCGGSFFIAYWRVLEIARVGKGEGVYPPPQKILVGKEGGSPHPSFGTVVRWGVPHWRVVGLGSCKRKRSKN